MLGATLPAAWGAWLVFLKPQVSIVLMILWIKPKKWLVLLPVLTLGVLMLLAWYRLPNLSGVNWSASIWPYGIPIGLALAWFAWKREDVFLALAASIFLSPYVAIQSWVFVLLPLTRKKWLLGVGVLISWVATFLFLKFAKTG